MDLQTSLFPETGMPPGFRYLPDIITPEEEAALAREIAALDLNPFEFRGYQGLRRVHSFGYRYDYDRRAVDAVDPIPPFLLALRDNVAAFAGRDADDFRQVLTTEYAPGAPIGWHTDKPQFGEVVGVSLISPCTLRLRRRNGAKWDRISTVLAPRSAYMLAGETRKAWEHSIPPMETLRYSVTFRTLADDFTPQDPPSPARQYGQ